jgi:hypothetical protein
LGGFEMGKRVYRVKKGDDFFKISRKLYGNASYAMDLMRANPGFNRVGPGMVLRLPKMDPRLTRKRKIKRRMKDYVPPEEPEDTTNQGIPSEGEEGFSEGEVSETENVGLSAAASALSGASLGGLDDPAFEDEIINSIAETAQKMGLIGSKMGKVSTASGKASSTTKPQFKTKEGGVVSSGLTTYSEAQTQAGESSQTATGSTAPPVTLTEEQIDTLKANLEKLGLDVDVAMAELGLGEVATASTTASQTTDTGVDGGDDGKDSPGGKVARPAEPEGPTQTETPDNEIPDYQDIETREELEAWFDAVYNPDSPDNEKDKLGKMFLEKRKELMRKKGAYAPTLSDEMEETLTEIAQDMGVDVDMLIGELGLVKRGDASLKENLKTLGIPPEIYYNASGVEKALIESDYIKLYNGIFIFPEEGGMYTPAGHFLDYSGFAEGYREWSEGEVDRNHKGYYILGGNESDTIEERLPDAAQYMSPRLLTGNQHLIDSIHYYLCGELSVIAALGLDIEEGMNIFANTKDYDDRILNHPDRETYASELENFINEAGRGQFNDAYTKSGDNAIDTPEEFIEHLEAGDKVIALVNIDGNQDGQLMSMDESGRDISHWVWVQDIIPTKEDDKPLVRVYNPYMNREEVYDWDTFAGAYEHTRGNDSMNLTVVAPCNIP